jgi:hypothetical protein
LAGAFALALAIAAPTGAFASSPGATITAMPSVGLVNGQQVTVTGSGLTPDVNGVLVECNSAPGQPTTEGRGIVLPVSCSNPFGDEYSSNSMTVVTTSATGTFQATFVVHTGVVGPPSSALDSAGNDPAGDAANYPCPPTPLQQAAGDMCWISLTDGGGDAAQADLSFGPAIGTTPVVAVQGGMEGGDTVGVRATGFAPSSPAVVEECNLTPGEPTQPFGPGPAIGCTQPVDTGAPGALPSTDPTGALSTSFTLQEGNVGGLAGSVAYPCPPTPANVARGGSCDIVVEDAGGNSGHAYLGLDGPVPVPRLAVSPATGLLNGQLVNVAGSGFSITNDATVFECNETPGEPTVDINGVQLPVGCSDPLRGSPFQFGLALTGPNGALGAPFVVHTGIVGPPEQTGGDSSGVDSSGGAISADTTAYPCPPTAAQRAAGATCAITVTDNSNETVSVPIAFGPPMTFQPSVYVVAVSGSIDLSNLAGGTEVVVTGSGFTPRSPAVIYECNLAPGRAVPLTSGVPGNCVIVQEVASLTTDGSGAVTANAVIVASNFSPDPGVPPVTVCSPHGSCAIVVVDAAGDQALVPIGISDSP